MGGAITAAFGVVGLLALAQPWIGVVAAYFVAILNPQTVWFWHFADFRPAYFVTLPLLAGAVVQGVMGKLSFDAVLNARMALMVTLLACCGVSAAWGPFAEKQSEVLIQTSGYILEIQAKIIALMLVASLCATAERPLRVLGWMLALCSVYLVWWANSTYLSIGWVFRLAGPTDPSGSGPYHDENNFAAFFVATLPFVWYMGFTLRSTALRLALWAVVPFGWHALFLTGSRGGLLGMAIVLLFITIRSGQRRYGVLLIAAFVAAFVWQAGDTMKERAASIDDYKQDESASNRLDAWAAATRMMVANPMTGVGPGAFLHAFKTYSDAFPIQAHNTYFQIGAEYGPLAAIALLGALASCMVALYRRGNQLNALPPDRSVTMLKSLNEATLTGLVGVVVCSMFLTLQLFEVLYFLVFLANAVDTVVRRRLAAQPSTTVAGADDDVAGATPLRPAPDARRGAPAAGTARLGSRRPRAPLARRHGA